MGRLWHNAVNHFIQFPDLYYRWADPVFTKLMLFAMCKKATKKIYAKKLYNKIMQEYKNNFYLYKAFLKFNNTNKVKNVSSVITRSYIGVNSYITLCLLFLILFIQT